jgi:transposase-like protein
MLLSALEAEVEDYVKRHAEQVDEEGRRLVVRNGRMPERTVLTGAGGLAVAQPRVHDRREGQRFSSSILPPYMRRSPSLEALIPALYLKGVSTGDFSEALEAILGPDAAGLSANTVTRLKQDWAAEYEEWSRRDLRDKRYVYWWADGIHFNVRLKEDRTCILVLMGALEDGTKELIAVVDGYRESELSWRDLMLDLKRRGLKEGPKLAVGDGALGFWAALREEFGDTREQRCWVHKTANILDKMPKGLQPRAKQRIHDMYMAETKEQALVAYEQFIALYESKYPKACQCLEKDQEVLLAFYDFPAEHWRHIRTTNPIESTFATVRHRTRRTKGCGTRAATLAMVYKLTREAEKHWRRMNGHKLIVKIFEGIKFKDGIEQPAEAA